VDLVARGDALQRPELRGGVARVADRVGAHRLDERLLEGVAQRPHDDEPLAGDAALAGIDHSRRAHTFAAAATSASSSTR
jgi:hypothetical protein